MKQFLTCFSVLLSLLAVAPLPATSAPVNATTLTKRGPTFGFPYGSQKVRGVNLGGWLVLEVSQRSSGGMLLVVPWLTSIHSHGLLRRSLPVQMIPGL